MGKILDLLLGRNSRKTSKLKVLLRLTVSRLAILRNHRQVRYAQARGDVAQLLQVGHIDRALLRVELVIKEQNMLEAFVMIEGCCHLIIERDVLLEHQRECPEELREAISSLIFAGSRCGDLPELQSARYIFASKFGKEFATAAVELRNNCGVNPKMVQKLSTRQPSLENKQRVMKEIAAEKGLKLDFGEPSAEVLQEDPNLSQRRYQSQPVENLLAELDPEENLSLGGRQQYKDVVSAAQSAFESAAYAAAAARAAVELSRTESQGKVSGDHGEPDSETKAELYEQGKDEDETLGGVTDDVKIHPVHSYSSESEEEIPTKKPREKSTRWLERSSSSSSSDSTEPPLLDKNKASNEPGSPGPKGKEILFDKSESETEMDRNLGANPLRMSDLASNEGLSDEERVTNLRPAYLRKPGRFNVNHSLHEEINKVGLGSRNEDNTAMYLSDAGSQTESVSLDPAGKLPMQYSNVWKKAVSMRTRGGF